MKVKEIIKVIQKDGWELHRIKGSHQHYKHPSKTGLVTVPGKLSNDVPKGTENSTGRA